MCEERGDGETFLADMTVSRRKRCEASKPIVSQTARHVRTRRKNGSPFFSFLFLSFSCLSLRFRHMRAIAKNDLNKAPFLSTSDLFFKAWARCCRLEWERTKDTCISSSDGKELRQRDRHGEQNDTERQTA